MNKDENSLEAKEENIITISLINTAIKNIFKDNEQNKEINDNQKYLNIILPEDIDSLLNTIKKIDSIYNYIYKKIKKKSNLYILLKRKIMYLNNLSMNRQNKVFKEKKLKKYDLILAMIIVKLKNYINAKNHKNLKNILLIIIRLIDDNIFPSNIFALISEIFINILLLILNLNSDNKYSLNDEPFIFINDIIESIIKYPKDLKIENTDNYILTDIIIIFDEYLITPNYFNINFKDNLIWLKFLENHMINPLKENKIINDKKNLNINDLDNNKEIIQKKIYCFLAKIYKFNLKDEYFHNNILKKGIINLKYSINIFHYLIYLFNEEEKILKDSSFKIINGFYLQKKDFLFLSNIKLKLNEYSLIFSFKIAEIPKDAENINILNIYNKPNKIILNISLDKDNYLNILYNGDKNWNTLIKIKENKNYLVCISQFKKLLLNYKFSLFINESINDDIIIDENSKGIKIEGCDSCYYYKKKFINIELSREMCIELGKNNFIGYLGEFFIINKSFTKDNIHNLFNLKENYSKILSQIYNKYENLNSYDSINWNKSKFDINNNNSNKNENPFITFFKNFGYEIKLEIMTYKINKFTKLKYFSQNYYNKELLNNPIKATNIKENNEINENNLSLISSFKSSNNSLDSTNAFSNTNYNSLSNSNSFNNSIYIYQKESSSKQEKIDINFSIFNLRYSSIVFYQNKGIEFLTLQLHNIISTIEDKNILDIYLYEIINFICEIMSTMRKDIIIFPQGKKSTPKLDNKISIFFLTLLTLLKKRKDTIFLNNDIILKLFELLDFFRFTKLFIQRNMILSILLEVKYYENKSDIMKYPTLLKTITSEITDNSNKDISLINDEILYKILMLDFIFQLKDYKHKLLMDLISTFITFDKYKENDDKELVNNIISEFLNYFLGLKNEIKIYHYLKIIYLNLTKIKCKLLNNVKFLENIKMKMENINTNHCKYCAFNQILYHLIYEETCFKSSSENDYCFHFYPSGFMRSPSFYFLKCIFFQCFSISNENKLKYIKSKKEDIQFFLSGIKNNNKNKDLNSINLDNSLLELIGYQKFIPRFEAIVAYIKFLLIEQKESNDIHLLNNIKDCINIIMSFFKEICSQRKKTINNVIYKNYRKTWSIINNIDNINNYLSESEKRSKEYKLMKAIEDFFKEFLCCNAIKNFYLIYLKINFKKAIEDINDFVIISARNIYNPFYFYFFSPNLYFDNEIIIPYFDNNDKNENVKEYIQSRLFKLLIDELAKSKIIYDDSQDFTLVQNNILLLIYLYQNIIINKIEIAKDFELNIILFLNFLTANFFIFSKYIFNINAVLNNNLKDNPNKKFILEIISDIYFILYDNTNYDLRYAYLIKFLFIDKNNSLMDIDNQYFSESKMKSPIYNFYNKDLLCSICNGVEVSEILYTIYSLYYLCEKLNRYQNNNIENKDNSEPLKLIKEIMISLLNNVNKLYNKYSQKIICVRKNIINRYPYKIYKNLIIFFEEKYKDKDLTLDKLIEQYYKLIAKKEINNERNEYFSNEYQFLKKFSIDSESNDNDIINENNTKKKENQNININNKNLNKIYENPLENKSKVNNKKSMDLNEINKLIIQKRAKSFIIKDSIKDISNEIHKNKSLKNTNKFLRKISNEESESENYLDNSLNNSFNLNENKKQNNINNIILIGNNDYKINVMNNNNISNKKNIEGNNKILENEYPILKNRKILKDDISDISEEENIIEEYDIKKKLKAINIPAKYYRNLFHLSDPNSLKILFNPKEYYFWNKFTLILKNIIFHHKKFKLLTKIYNLKFRNVDIERSLDSKNNNYYLKYPTKLKNFINDDYYRPFIKPDINFFKYKLLAKSHSYLRNNFFNKNFSDEDNLSKIKFERILPINYDLKHPKKIVCELINNKGSIYGHIYFNHAFLLFISDTSNDPRLEKTSSYTNGIQEEFYLYSYFLEERLKNKKKYVLMHFSEIKEIFIRRFCLNYIGYEVFMKDNRSYLFNFFNKNNLKDFLKLMSEKLELSYKKQNVNNIPFYSHNENILSLQILNYNINNAINFNVINDPIYDFEKKGYKSKYQKG